MNIRFLIKLYTLIALIFIFFVIWSKDSLAQTCNDSDGGLNYYQTGSVTTPTGIYKDYCIQVDKIYEEYCDGSSLKSNVYDCKTQNPTWNCFNGECCAWPGDTCGVDSDCCINNSCQNGMCLPTSDILLNEAFNMSCRNYCMDSGFEGCRSIGTDPGASNGLTYIYPGSVCTLTNTYTCDTVVYSSSTSLCGEFQTEWTRCKCYGYNYPTPPPPTPTPFPSPTPNPELPTPFLDLPWDYESKGMSFNDAALAINSYFDHEYPLLSAGLGESGLVIAFRGFPRRDISYSSHDGYDYGKSLAKLQLNDPVLSAASGCASYRYTRAGGNQILIDHENYYQTRYYHLQPDGLVTKKPSCIQVIKGQQIGKVGFSGNVKPPSEAGSHLHFMVIEDKNKDGNFEDNIPDGVTDPFGWQSEDVDPWPNYNFIFGGMQRNGNKSYYLWTKAIANFSKTLPSNGGLFELERYSINFPQDATTEDLSLKVVSVPTVNQSKSVRSIGSGILVTARNSLGNLVTNFYKYFTIAVTFNPFDINSYRSDSISIYSSSDGINWTKEETSVELGSKTAVTEVHHLSYFALMAERLDTTSPITNLILNGQKGDNGWFKSDVEISLDAQDNEGGLGVDYTLYKIDEEDWQQYMQSFIVSDEGSHKIEYYSVDKDENIEETKLVEISIDKTPPIITSSRDRK